MADLTAKKLEDLMAELEKRMAELREYLKVEKWVVVKVDELAFRLVDWWD